MHSRVNRMSQNLTQGARVLPGACAVLTCVFGCMCYFNTEHEQHACTPCGFESWYITSRWRLIQKVLVNMYRVQYLIPAILHYLNFQFPLNKTVALKTVALKTVVLKTVVLNIYYCFHSIENMGIKFLHASIINAYHTYTLKLVAQATRCPELNSQWLLALSLSHLNIKLTVCTSC